MKIESKKKIIGEFMTQKNTKASKTSTKIPAQLAESVCKIFEKKPVKK